MQKDRALPTKAILIVNGASRKGAELFEQARELLVAAGIQLLDAWAVTDPEDLSSGLLRVRGSRDGDRRWW